MLDAADPTKVTFTPPRNYTDGDIGYRLTIRSKEAPAAAVILNVTVKNETDPTKKTMEDFMQELIKMQQENQQKIDELQDQINSIGSADTGTISSDGAGENP